MPGLTIPSMKLNPTFSSIPAQEEVNRRPKKAGLELSRAAWRCSHTRQGKTWKTVLRAAPTWQGCASIPHLHLDPPDSVSITGHQCQPVTTAALLMQCSLCRESQGRICTFKLPAVQPGIKRTSLDYQIHVEPEQVSSEQGSSSSLCAPQS